MSQFAMSANVYWGQDKYEKLFDLTLSQRIENLELKSIGFSKENLKCVLKAVYN